MFYTKHVSRISFFISCLKILSWAGLSAGVTAKLMRNNSGVSPDIGESEKWRFLEIHGLLIVHRGVVD